METQKYCIPLKPAFCFFRVGVYTKFDIYIYLYRYLMTCHMLLIRMNCGLAPCSIQYHIKGKKDSHFHIHDHACWSILPDHVCKIRLVVKGVLSFPLASQGHRNSHSNGWCSLQVLDLFAIGQSVEENIGYRRFISSSVLILAHDLLSSLEYFQY